MVTAKKTKKSHESINSRLACFMKSGKYTLGNKIVLHTLRSSKAVDPEKNKAGYHYQQSPPLRLSEIEYNVMLAKVEVQHYNRKGLDFIKEAISRTGYGEKIKIAIDVVFEEIDLVPMESASLAQVHVARTHDGKKLLLRFYTLLFLPQSSFSMLSKVQAQYTHMINTAAADHATMKLLVNTLHKFLPSFDYRYVSVWFMCLLIIPPSSSH
ncbi:hypothetical protein Pint_05716 [Pistacia integerrima]|uniref:Uncharacterized protein n=1 Tax=Pistacia integerrima TaxID=434235 RepID=A0ACC0Z5Q1_9ROSI|nr:hypothetical protein Pint_05716 [Pistacia integerrima]